MDAAKLTAFVAVAERRSFSSASADLELSQSTVSTRVRELERELGQALFVRTSRRVTLTAAGTAALPMARSALAHMRSLSEVVDEVAGLHRGTVRLGIIAGAAHEDLPELLARFSTSHPDIELTITSAPSADLERALEQGELDIGYLVTAEPSPLFRHWTHDPLCAVALPPNSRGQVPISTLLGKRLIVLDSGASARSKLERVARGAGIRLTIGAQVADPALALDLGAHDLGYPIMPRAVSPPGSPVLVDRQGAPITVSAGLAAQTQHQSPAAELLLDTLKDLVPDEPR
ncbi:LysR family transcriptional regulator [Nocardioides albus]|uniref:DNA-binding transcriptional LysR family regulator n=1 Tax=Nocardioides albus TaxID=1841 RepID=A0A7W5F7B3_9ACTN|nr:LysR family transcriptional regulator [Nocardioides albus]MBB3087985.1 DNA-binding transcriptional LysR family regulator [Nocardioides albus]GGU21789.1 LysR family transcriptional regulator [Nocardioides albus]